MKTIIQPMHSVTVEAGPVRVLVHPNGLITILNESIRRLVTVPAIGDVRVNASGETKN